MNPLDRYHRQTLLPQIGRAGQDRLAAGRALLVGCGALGGVIAEQLVRAGVGFLRLVDRDIVELTNLQRQVLFDESDVRDGLPKAMAAAKRLGAINSNVRLDPRVHDLDPDNVEELMRDSSGALVDVVLDGTDNVETRYLLNDACVKHNVPWIYGACVGTEGRMLSILPGQSACLRCVFPQPPSPGELPTCDTAGVLGSVATMIASMQVVAAIKIILRAEINPELVRLDGWTNQLRTTSTADARRADCPTCALRRFDFLDSTSRGTTKLCGRQSIQVRPASRVDLKLSELADRLGAGINLQTTPHLLRFVLPDDPQVQMTVFADGRAIVSGLSDPARARSIYARFVGV